MNKATIFLLCMLSSLFITSGCIEMNRETPEEVALNFLTAIQSHDWEKAKSYATETTIKELDVLSELPGNPEYNEVSIVGNKTEGDKATVTYFYTPKGGSETGGESEELSLDLVRNDRHWKVETNKQAMTGSASQEDELLKAQIDKALKGLENEVNEEIRQLENAQKDSLNALK